MTDDDPTVVADRVSVLIPVYNNASTLEELHRRITATLTELDIDYEIVFVEDGGPDNSWEVIAGIAAGDPLVKALRLARNAGQAQAYCAGMIDTTGAIVVTIDADLENWPEDIPRLVDAVRGGADFVSGWRTDRRWSAWVRWLPSAALNMLLRRWTGVNRRDAGCGLNAMRRWVGIEVLDWGQRRRHVKASWALAAETTEDVEVRWTKVGRRSGYGLVDLVELATDLLGFTTRSFAVLITVGLITAFAGLLGTTVAAVILLFGVDSGSLGVASVLVTLAGSHFAVTGMVGFYVVRTLHGLDAPSTWRVAERIGTPVPDAPVPDTPC